MTAHTKGPWVAVEPVAIDYRPMQIQTADSLIAVCCGGGPKRAISAPEERTNARLIATAPDHAAIAAALCSGAARWEAATNEFCIAGIRHSTKLDEFGVPVMTSNMRAAIAKATTP